MGNNHINSEAVIIMGAGVDNDHDSMMTKTMLLTEAGMPMVYIAVFHMLKRLRAVVSIWVMFMGICCRMWFLCECRQMVMSTRMFIVRVVFSILCIV